MAFQAGKRKAERPTQGDQLTATNKGDQKRRPAQID
jgi:hypothetical protein